jgi:hypothetical protein
VWNVWTCCQAVLLLLGLALCPWSLVGVPSTSTPPCPPPLVAAWHAFMPHPRVLTVKG